MACACDLVGAESLGGTVPRHTLDNELRPMYLKRFVNNVDVFF